MCVAPAFLASENFRFGAAKLGNIFPFQFWLGCFLREPPVLGSPVPAFSGPLLMEELSIFEGDVFGGGPDGV